jgi:hypothetical protein
MQTQLEMGITKLEAAVTAEPFPNDMVLACLLLLLLLLWLFSTVAKVAASSKQWLHRLHSFDTACAALWI